MASHSGSWYPIGEVQWDANGNPYRNTSDGLVDYIPPIAAAQYRDDPRMLAWAASKGAAIDYSGAQPQVLGTGVPASGTFLHGVPEWNSETGQYEYPNFFNTPVGGLVLGGSAVAAPFVASALLPSASASAGSAAPAAAGTGLTSEGLLASTPISMGTPTLPAALTSMSGIPGASGMSLTDFLTNLGKNTATNAATNAVNNVTGGGGQSNGSKTAEAMALIGGLLAGQLIRNQGANNVPPQVNQLLDLGMQQRVARTPIFNAVNQGVFKMLPTYATQGIAPPTPMTYTPSPTTQASNSGGDSGLPSWLIPTLTGAGGFSLATLMNGNNPYDTIANGLKKLFTSGQSTSPTSAIDPTTWQTVGPPDPNDPTYADWSVS